MTDFKRHLSNLRKKEQHEENMIELYKEIAKTANDMLITQSGKEPPHEPANVIDIIFDASKQNGHEIKDFFEIMDIVDLCEYPEFKDEFDKHLEKTGVKKYLHMLDKNLRVNHG